MPAKPPAAAPGPAAPGPGPDPMVGQPAPDVALWDQDGKEVRLRDFRGKHVVLYFYPADMTPGCTAQSCAYNDHLADFRRLGAAVLGVSPDDAASHRRFIAKHDLGFPLLYGEGTAALEAFGVWQEKRNYGRTYMGVVRSTFILAPDGTVAAAWRKVKAEEDPANALAFLRAQGK